MQCDICDKTFLCNLDLEVHKEKEHAFNVTVHTQSQHTPNESLSRTPPCPASTKCGQPYPNEERDQSFRDYAYAQSRQVALLQPVAETPSILHTYSNQASHIQDGYLCQVCGIVFSTLSNLAYHVSEAHPLTAEPYSCHLCEKLFPTFQQAEDHFASHRQRQLHTCAQCGYTCESSGLMSLHLLSHHNQPRVIHCTKCELTFESMLLLNMHVAQSHTEFQENSANSQQPSPLPNCHPTGPDINNCSYCGKTFNTIVDLQVHTYDNHIDHSMSNPESLIVCTNVQAGNEDMNTHLSSRDLTGDLDTEPLISPIAQLDGADDDSIVCTDMENLPRHSKNHLVSTIVAQYTLNEKKQLAGLNKNSKLDHFEIVCNDGGKNVILQCNTGFYEAVAKPAFSSISVGFQTQCGPIHVECIESRNTCDKAANLPGKLLRFKLYGHGIVSNPATLAVHLHHTQQKVQVQGGADMPDQSKVATWFVNNVLKDKFIAEARIKKFDIENINKVVSQLNGSNPLPSASATSPSNIPSFCPHCKKKFSSNSKPVECSRCSLFRHKMKCSPCPVSSYSSSQSVLTLTSSSNPVLVAPAPTSLFTSDVNVQPMSKRMRQTPDTSPLTSSPAPGPPIADSSSTTTTSLLSSVSLMQSSPVAPTSASASVSRPLLSGCSPELSPGTSDLSLASLNIPRTCSSANNPVISSTISTPATLSMLSQPTVNPRKRKANQKSPIKSPEQAEIDYLKIELNAVRTQVIELETSKTDLERKIKIMEEVIKMHEQRQAANAYKDILTDPNKPSQFNRQSQQQPQQSQQSAATQSYPWYYHWPPHMSCPPALPNCCHVHHSCYKKREEKPTATADTNDKPITDLYIDLKTAVTNIQAEMIDIVNKVESITDPARTHKHPNKPLYRNPVEIPNYDAIDVITEAEVHIDPQDESIVSIDEFVPDISVARDLSNPSTLSLN